jgi:hypothetical protein
VRLSQDLASFTSDYAKEGTLAHTKAAQWLTFDLEPTFAADAAGREMRAAVQAYVLICKSYTTDVAVDMGAVYGIEDRVDLSSVYPGCFGTADFWGYWPWLKKLIVIDFKYGAGVFVSVVDNLQAQYYALGVMVGHPEFEVETVELGICQPRCQAEGEPFRTVTLTHDDLTRVFRTRLADAAAQTQHASAPLVPGEHCRWCPANQHRVCPAVTTLATVHAQQVFSDALSYDPAALARALDARPALKAYLSALDEFAYRELEKGAEIPGYKLVAKRPQRVWTDEAGVTGHLRAAGYGDTIYAVQTLKSPAQMEEMLGKTRKGLIAEFVEKRSSGHTVVPMDDDRPSVKLGAQQVFGVIEVNPFD